jgi:mRNA interferase RelE/StbE
LIPKDRRLRVELTPAARRQLDRLRGPERIAIRGVALALSDEPRPRGALKLQGRSDLWRVRVRIDGRSWRVIYRVLEKQRLVVVTKVVPRDEGTYRNI